MAENLISFQSDSIDFDLDKKDTIREWLRETVVAEGFDPGEIAFVFTGDESLLEINQKYLNHDTYTDIITFDYSEDETISGEIYISIERVRDNALKYAVNSTKELHRVMIHGILHLCGYSDKESDAKATMTGKEDYYLSLRTF
ncbi:rRNA maturation RNase YbeY [Cryomorpha ignava]|uniref:Endoribonuclease YbeY n=1 Tax=Cryomorpha ignava TaxID=101383 RepID=A0A7K3WKF7_9FLAO|nr:rRNA maturation RNase YbeY [Cryomorpha ignava]NEN22126.1 rRNA maturation RNase YbeY [Cryomorpha ignava]